MALTDQVIMPGSDYQAICDATRSLTGTTGILKSGEVAAKILDGVKTETKTVALSMASGNQVINSTSGKYMTQVTVTKPSTLIPANIKSRANIGGVIGGLMDFNARLLASKSITDGVISFTDQQLYHTLIAKNSINNFVFITGIVGDYNSSNTFSTACHSYGSQYSDVSSIALVVSYNSSTQLYTYTWNVAESSSAYFYDCAIEVYGIQ